MAGALSAASLPRVSATALPRLEAPGLASARGALRALGAVAASAALYGLAFAPLPGAWVAAWVALAPLFAAAACAGPLRAAGLGLLFGAAGGLATCWWLPEMLQRFFGVAPLASWLAAAASFVAFAGLHYAAFAAWLGWLARRAPVSPALVGLGWAACEWARASLGVANPWALSAYSQIDFRPLVQLADVAGPWGIAALLGAVNALLAGAFVPALRPPRPLRAAACYALAVAAAVAYGEIQLARDHADGDAVKVAIVQSGIARPDRSEQDPARSRAELERHLALSAEAIAAARPALVLWPEGALDFSPFEATQRSLRLRDASRALGVDLLLGAPRRDDAGLRHNAMIHLRRGRVRGVQDKLELMPFSETDPLPGPLALGRDAYAPGREIQLFEAAGLRIGSAICSEAMAPGVPQRLVAAGATLLVNPSNDYWFVSPAAARQQLAKARFRAIETRRFVARATSTGYSALIDPRGDLLAVSGFGGAEWLEGSVRGATGTSLHQRAAGALAPLLLFAVAAGTLRHVRGSRSFPGGSNP
jgi:apolipoprotein N-acyltransferase